MPHLNAIVLNPNKELPIICANDKINECFIVSLFDSIIKIRVG